MEQQRFDAVSRWFARGVSRRGVFGSLIGGIVGLRSRDVSAVCRKGGVACSAGNQCCTGKCLKAIGRCSCTKSGKGRCKPPENPCKRAVCNEAGRCVRQNRAAGFECGDGMGCNAAGTCVPTCKDGVLSPGETDIDCGGSCPTKCAEGLRCKTNADCQSGMCGAEDKCLPATCGNGKLDEGETDIDCGGSCLPCTSPGAGCLKDSDCNGGVCCDGKCLDCEAGRVCNPDTGECCSPRSFCEACSDTNDPGGDGCGGRYDCGDGTDGAVCPPVFGIGFDPPPQPCCNDGDCPCGKDSNCCADERPGDDKTQPDACFVKPSDDGQSLVEFCCRSQGPDYRVCGNVCCSGDCDENGECPRTSGRLGSYRRGTTG